MGFFDKLAQSMMPPGLNLPPEALQALLRQQMLMGGMQLLGGIGQQPQDSPYGPLFSTLAQGMQGFQGGALDLHKRRMGQESHDSEQAYFNLRQKQIQQDLTNTTTDRERSTLGRAGELEGTIRELEALGVDTSGIETVEEAKERRASYYRMSKEEREKEAADRAEKTAKDQEEHRTKLEEQADQRIGLAIQVAQSKRSVPGFDGLKSTEQIRLVRSVMDDWDKKISDPTLLVPEEHTPPEPYMTAKTEEERALVATIAVRGIVGAVQNKTQTAEQNTIDRTAAYPLPPELAQKGMTPEEWASMSPNEQLELIRTVRGF